LFFFPSNLNTFFILQGLKMFKNKALKHQFKEIKKKQK